RRYLSREDLLDTFEHLRLVAARAERVFGANRVTVHGGSRERRHIERRDDVARHHAAVRVPERHTLGPHQRSHLRVDQRTCFVERDRLADRTHLRRHVDTCCTTWPSSGITRRVSASRTAFSDPGSTKMAFRAAVPAMARLSIAAGPISWKLSMRNSS